MYSLHGSSTFPYSASKDFFDFSFFLLEGASLVIHLLLHLPRGFLYVCHLFPFFHRFVNLGVFSYIGMINKVRQYRLPTTNNLKWTSPSWWICLSIKTELGHIQQLNPILLSIIHQMMQIFSEHIVEALGLNFERFGHINDPKNWTLSHDLLYTIEGGLTLEVSTPLNVFFQ